MLLQGLVAKTAASCSFSCLFGFSHKAGLKLPFQITFKSSRSLVEKKMNNNLIQQLFFWSDKTQFMLSQVHGRKA